MRGHPHAIQTSPGRTPARLAQWRALTREGNRAFAALRFPQAVRAYEEALGIASELLAAPALAISPDECLAAWVVAHHNLSDAHLAHGEFAAALDYLCLPHDAVMHMASDPDAPACLRDAAFRHLREIRLALLHWQRVHGACARTWTDALLHASHAALCVPRSLSPRH